MCSTMGKPQIYATVSPPMLTRRPPPPFSFQVDNMRKMDSREVFMPSPGKEIRDTELGDLVRRAIVAKAESRVSKVKV